MFVVLVETVLVKDVAFVAFWLIAVLAVARLLEEGELVMPNKIKEPPNVTTLKRVKLKSSAGAGVKGKWRVDHTLESESPQVLFEGTLSPPKRYLRDRDFGASNR